MRGESAVTVDFRISYGLGFSQLFKCLPCLKQVLLWIFQSSPEAGVLPLAKYPLPCHFPQLHYHLPRVSLPDCTAVTWGVSNLHSHRAFFSYFYAQDSSNTNTKRCSHWASKTGEKNVFYSRGAQGRWWVPYVYPFVISVLLFCLPFVSYDQPTASQGCSCGWKCMVSCVTSRSQELGFTWGGGVDFKIINWSNVPLTLSL